MIVERRLWKRWTRDVASLSTVIQKMTVPMLAKHVVRTILKDSYFLEPLSDSLFPYLSTWPTIVYLLRKCHQLALGLDAWANQGDCKMSGTKFRISSRGGGN